MTTKNPVPEPLDDAAATVSEGVDAHSAELVEETTVLAAEPTGVLPVAGQEVVDASAQAEAELRGADADVSLAAAAPQPAWAAGGPAYPVAPPPVRPGLASGAGSALRRGWASRGGRAAMILVASLALLGLVGGIALAAFHRGRGDDRRMGNGQVFGRDGQGMGQGQGQGQGGHPANGQGNGMGQGQQGWGQGNGMGPGMGGDDDGFGDGQGSGDGQGFGAGPGFGGGQPGMRGGLDAGAMGLGSMLHGEFVVAGSDGKPVTMVVQTGTVTAYTKGSSIAVKSTDGVETTYKLSNTPGYNGPVAVGQTVRVLANKDGLVATAVVVLAQAPAGNTTSGSST